jgi:TctA family transporter
MIHSVSDLLQGFSVALEPNNLLWSLVGVLIGNLIGVLPGLGPLSAMSILLPLTYVMSPVPAILMLAGIFYGSQYGGAIGAILLNLPAHPPHAVTCIDGYPMTRQGRGGVALGIAMLSSFFAASVGIIVMVVASPLLVKVAFDFGPGDIFSIMLLGLICGGTLSRGTPLKGMSMTMLGLLLGMVGTDINTGTMRFTLGFPMLFSGVQLVALALGLFGVADFLRNVNKMEIVISQKLRVRDMRPSWTDLKQAFWPMVRGTAVGTLFGAMPGTGATITTFIAYALEKRISRTPERFGKGAIEGVAGPEASSHSKTQVDFIPTMSLGIPGDPVMALILGGLLVQGITPGPQLISEHADLFWGLIASFWTGNIFLILLNVPLIGIWVRLLKLPYRYLFPAAIFFICIGVYSTNNSLFEVGEVLVFGVAGALLMAMEFPISPILLGYVLGPLIEENFRRALEISGGDFSTFVRSPISASVLTVALLIILAQALFWVLSMRRGTPIAPQLTEITQGGEAP